MLSYSETFHDLRQALLPLYDAGEAAAIAREFLHQATGLSYSQGITRDAPLPAVTAAFIERGKEALRTGKPLHYVTGRAEFLGRSFLVDERVLIPRPETEELVQWILEDWDGRPDLSVVEVGAGSGCIAVSLALGLPAAAVTACDISGEALAVARQNAGRLDAPVRFLQLDFREEQARGMLPAADILVSNPPYIPDALRDTLHANVRDWEPGTALFVPDADPFLFYRLLAAWGATGLKPGGAVYCELHAGSAEAVAGLFREAGYEAIAIREDLGGHPRMLKAQRQPPAKREDPGAFRSRDLSIQLFRQAREACS